MKILCKFTKRGYLKFISHLDLVSLFHRELRLNNVDIKFTNGFNPHPKMSIPYPLPLGVESESEYIEIYINKEIDIQYFIESMNNTLPDGIKIISARYDDDRSVSNLVGGVIYRFHIEDSYNNYSYNMKDIIKALNNSEYLTIERKRKSKRRKIIVNENAKEFISKFKYLDAKTFDVYIKIKENGSLKPSYIADILNKEFYLDLKEENISIERIALIKSTESEDDIY